MSKRAWIPTLALVLVAPVLMAAKCASPGGGIQQACDLVESRAPHWVAGQGKGSISAAVRAYCDPRPKSHRLTVWLEREASDGKTWFQVGGSAVYGRAADIPPPPPGRNYTITTGCIDGNWRVRARAVGASSDGRPFDFTIPAREALISVIRCRLQ